MTDMSRPPRIRRLNRILAGTAIAGLIHFSVVVCATPVHERDEVQAAGSGAMATFGHWSVLDFPVEFRVNAIHAALLSTGKVLIIAGSGNSTAHFEAASFKTLLWNPQTDEFSLIPTPEDMFCAGHAFLPDGKLLIAGGNRRYEVAGQDVTRAAGPMTVTNESRDGSSVTLPEGTKFVSPQGTVFASVEAAAVLSGASVEVWVEAAVEGTGSVINTPSRFRINGVSSNVYGAAEKLTMETQLAWGAAFSYEFDPQTERYQRVADMDHGRWYPTVVGLADGDALAVSGLDEFGRTLNSHERYHGDTEQWTEVSALNRYFPTYPALFLMADGRLFYSGSHGGYGRSDGTGRLPGIWNLTDNSFRPVEGLRDPHLTETSASVLLPPAQDQRIMVLGGGGIDDSAESTARTDIVDLRAADPRFRPGPDLAQPTRHLSAVILPDDTVLTTGGSRDYRGRGDSNNHIARIYDPATGSFRAAASPQVGRNYHSEALLLPDGRVVTLGSEIDGGGDNGEPGAFEQRIEIYSPPYLHRGSRPELTGGPTALPRGGIADFQTPDPSSVAAAKLIRPSAVTHTTDIEQRSVALDITRKDQAISLTVPAQPGLVPSGWYMLFVTDRSNTPSIARWVHVQ
ncbi:MAG: galactose oxidase early set domain-containing protein [Actinomycetota bacterium]|nr:galactose oxidase early set domain-containing protein [Actinomycetota bacterium]